MKREIGSDFWESPLSEEENQFMIEGIPRDWEYSYFVSGRSAIYVAAKSIAEQGDVALVPYYTCETISNAIKNAGFLLVRYEIEINLLCNISDVLTKLNQIKPKILYLQSYFGFDTINDQEVLIKTAHSNGTIVMEDLTHAVFSTFKKTCADIYVLSLRKYIGIEDGGVVISPNKYESIVTPELKIIDKVANEAFLLKQNYIEDLTVDNKVLFREKYKKLNELINCLNKNICISDAALERIKKLNTIYLTTKRVNNYYYLNNGLKNISQIVPLKTILKKTEIPLFYPIYVQNELRQDMQRFLAENEIYAPVIWPKDRNIREINEEGDFIYNHILCIPCDQRYDLDDMDRIIKMMKLFFGDKNEKYIDNGWRSKSNSFINYCKK